MLRVAPTRPSQGVVPTLGPHRLKTRLPESAAVKLAPPSEAMHGGDAIWFQFDQAAVHALMTLMGYVTREEVIHMVHERLYNNERFVQVPDVQHGRWHATDFAAAAHVHEIEVPKAAHTGAEFDAFMLAETEKPFAQGMSPWSVLIFRRGTAEETTTVVVSVHHGMADANALTQALLSCNQASVPATVALDLRHLKAPTNSLFRLLYRIVQPARMLLSLVTTAWMGPDPESSIKRTPLMVRQQLDTCQPVLELCRVKDIAKTLLGENGTINDVMFCALGGALRKVMEDAHDPVDSLRLRCLKPAMLEAPGGRAKGNAIGFAICDIPSRQKDRLQRLQAAHKSLRTMKYSQQAHATAFGMGLLGNLWGALVRLMSDRMTNACSVFFSSVHGTPFPLQIANHRITDVRWYPPRFGNIGVELSVISYDGKLSFCVATRLPCSAKDFAALILWEIKALEAEAAASKTKPAMKKLPQKLPASCS